MTWSNPLTGMIVKTVDANKKRTVGAYDKLGRLTKVWYPDRDPQQYATSPSVTYAYTVEGNGLNAVVTSTLAPTAPAGTPPPCSTTG